MNIFDLIPSKKKQQETNAEASLDDRVLDALRQVYDPEIPVNIYDMGLIYRIDRHPETNHVKVDMTLTTPNCPAAQELPVMVKEAVESVDEIPEAEVEIVWDPPWGPEQMSEEAKMELGFI